MYVLGMSENLDADSALELLNDVLETGEFRIEDTGEVVLLEEIDKSCIRSAIELREFESNNVLFDGHSLYGCTSGCVIAAGGHYHKCSHCGTWVDVDRRDVRQIGGGYLCSDECVTGSGYVQCSQCDSWVRERDAIEIEGEFYCDSDCAYDADWRRCERCGEWHSSDETEHVRNFGTVCEDCADYHYYRCERCDEYVTWDDWDDEEDMCSRCSEAEELHSYGYTPMLEFFGDTDGNSKPFLGVELETDGGSDRPRYVRGLANLETSDRFWMTKDSSIRNGVEVTSHPMTLDEHIGCGLWEDVRATALEHGFGSHNGGRCGLHIHVNRDFFGKSPKVQEVGGFKMMRLMQRFETQFTTFSRRANHDWCSYKMSRDYSPKNPKKKVDVRTGSNPYEDREVPFIKKASNCVGYETEHNQAVNFQHRKTFEVRICRGTLLLSTFYASLAMVQGLARACKSHGEAWVESVSWYGLMEWIIADCDNLIARDHLVAYLNNKGLFLNETETTAEEN